MRIRTTSIADDDVVKAAAWFDRQEAGLGANFIAAVEKSFAIIQEDPGICPTLAPSNVVYKASLRWRSVPKFPFITLFSIGDDEIVVIAVVHSHRDIETVLRQRVGILP